MSISKGKRKKVYKRDSNKCLRCGTKENLSIDHIIPRSKGGHNGHRNMQTLCVECNQWKGERTKRFQNKRI